MAKSLGLKYLHLHASKDGINIYRKAGFVEPKLPELVAPYKVALTPAPYFSDVSNF